MLVHNPRNNLPLRNIAAADISLHYFRAVPDFDSFSAEYQSFIQALKLGGVEPVDIADLIDADLNTLLDSEPNSIFTRDAIITLPWAADTAIVANMTLIGRRSEPAIAKRAVRKLGITDFYEFPASIYLEGGDTIAAVQNGKRVLYVGAGPRTHNAAADWLARTLIPRGLVDEVVCLRHTRAMIHLDTCFAILPNQTILLARTSLTDVRVIHRDFTSTHYDPLPYFTELGYQLIWVGTNDAVSHESCNILSLGNQRCLAFTMPQQLARRIEVAADVRLRLLAGAEISKANGGTHCLARPIY